MTANTLHKKNGITLTELLVASVLIGIVMMGAAAFSISIQRLQGATNKSTILAMRARRVMTQITKDAYSAVGNITSMGVQSGGAGGSESICFRHDVPVTPDDNTDDEWTCYFADATKILWLCGGPPTLPANVPVDNVGDCNANGGKQELLTLNDNNFSNIQVDGSGRLEHIQISLTAIYDLTLAVHPITNPTYTLTTQIRPPGHN